MLRFTVEHKHCGVRKVIEGYNVFDAFRRNGLDLNIWIVMDTEKI